MSNRGALLLMPVLTLACAHARPVDWEAKAIAEYELPASPERSMQALREAALRLGYVEVREPQQSQLHARLDLPHDSFLGARRAERLLVAAREPGRLSLLADWPDGNFGLPARHPTRDTQLLVEGTRQLLEPSQLAPGAALVAEAAPEIAALLDALLPAVGANYVYAGDPLGSRLNREGTIIARSALDVLGVGAVVVALLIPPSAALAAAGVITLLLNRLTSLVLDERRVDRRNQVARSGFALSPADGSFAPAASPTAPPGPPGENL